MKRGLSFLSAGKRKPGRKQWLGVIGLAFVLVAAGTLWLLLWHKPAAIEVTIFGSSAEIGTQYGEALGAKMRLLTRVYLDGVVCQKNPEVIKARRSKALASLQQWPEKYVEELKAVASAAGIEEGALAYANSFLDFGQARGGCRSVVVALTNGVLHAHNLDWDNLGGLGKWSTCLVRRRPQDGRLATVSVGFPGVIGALDIINEKGLAFSFNQLGIGRGPVSEPVLILVRRMAENCVSLDQARREILNASPGMPFIITVSDPASGTGAVFERTRDDVVERPLTSGWVSACNVAQGTTVGITTLDRVMASALAVGPHDLGKVLTDPGVMMGCNIYSVVFDFRGNRMFLASGAIPAATGGYREFRLFP